MDTKILERLVRQFVAAKNQGDRAAALILRGRIYRQYLNGRAAGLWKDYAREMFDV